MRNACSLLLMPLRHGTSCDGPVRIYHQCRQRQNHQSLRYRRAYPRKSRRQTVPGFLFNKGRGRTEFRRALQQLNATTYLDWRGAYDFLHPPNGLDAVEVKPNSALPAYWARLTIITLDSFIPTACSGTRFTSTGNLLAGQYIRPRL